MIHKKYSKLFFTIIISLIIVISPTAIANDLTTHYLDVGQADSILIQLPNGQNMLIDAGNNEDGDMVVQYIKSKNISEIDFLVGTHPHEDHIGGLDDVINSFEIGNIYMPKVTHTSKTYEDVLIAAKNKGEKIIAAKAGIILVDKQDLNVRILSPITSDYEELNNWSVVVKVTYGSNSYLFMGDAEEKVEFQLLSKSSNVLDSDVLKVGHHGSNSSTSDLFIEAISPEYAVISVDDDNRYGHPSPLVINRLNKQGVKVFRTDKQGTIISYSDGKHITFNKTAEKAKPIEQKNTSSIKITRVDLKDEIVVIKNTGNSYVVLSEWKLVSVKGNQEFYFPDEVVLQPGETIIVASGRNAGEGPKTIVWTNAYIWNNDGDKAELYNNKGKLISSYD